MTEVLEAANETLTEGLSAHLVSEVRKISAADVSEHALERARHAVLDWVGVTISGGQQASSRIAQQICREEGGSQTTFAVGAPGKMTARQSALCTGIASHSQDFDDMGFFLHPSIVVLPAAFAVVDELDADGKTLLESLLMGYETLRISMLTVTDASYARGWHCTGTFGALSSAIAAGSALGLDAEQMLQSLGTAGTMASGLRSSFGTMGKHLNSGNASAAGVLAAKLVQAGFTGARDVLESPKGFASAFNFPSDAFDPNHEGISLGERLGVEEIIFKLHAACGGTHSAIDGIRSIRARRPFTIDEVEGVEFVVPALTPGVCGIENPKTGLEGMFSVHFAAAVALADRETGTAAFTDETVRDPVLVAAQRLVKVTPVDRLSHMSHPTETTLTFKNGDVETARIDIFKPRSDEDLGNQWNDLVEKFHALVAPILGDVRSEQLVETIARFETLGSVRELTAMTIPNS